MTRALPVFFALALLAAAGAAHADTDETLAGIALRQPLLLEECPQRQGEYLPDDRSTCFQLEPGPARDDDTHPVPRNGRIKVNVALADRPAFMSGSDATVTLKDGLVQSISVQTHGTGQDMNDLHALQDRFGRTSQRYLSTAQPYQTYANVRADWQLGDGVTVYFSSAEFGRYRGLVRMQTQDAPPHQNGMWD
jgi:hypothetical protein